MPSTFVHGLLPPACVWFSKPELPSLTKRERFRLLVASVLLANAPDLDLVPASLAFEHWLDVHRHWGHNLFVLSAFVCLGAWGLRKWVSSRFTRTTAWILSFLLVGSHVVLDAMQSYGIDGTRPGVPLLWPLSEWQFRLPIPLFRIIQVHSVQNPIITHLTSRDFWGNVFLYEICYILLLFVGWAVMWRLVTRVPSLFSRKSAYSVRR